MNVAQLSGFEIVEVMMGRAGGIVYGALGIEMNLTYEPVLGEHFERVVDGRFRYSLAAFAHGREDLLGGEVLRGAHQDGSDADPLIRRLQSSGGELGRDLISAHGEGGLGAHGGRHSAA